MTPPPSELFHAAPWQAALVAAPALVCALGALAAGRAGTAAGAWRAARGAATLALLLAAASAAATLLLGGHLGVALRADALGAGMALLVGFIGWVIVRYSQTGLAGEPGEARYARWLLLTLAAVGLVVASNHLLLLALAWMGTSLALNRLLRFYGDRAPALVAAHKKFLLGRAADGAMLAACGLFAWAFGTWRIDGLVAAAAAAPALPLAAQVAVVLVAVAALLKCAALPFHGWLIQVMEAPTPVSALLHAGVVNLGGFVLIRLAPLVAEVPAAAGLLVLAGTATAVVAALVMTTRISVKVALAWSTCAQMGFMLMQCGLGLWEMALLHLVAHSLYKAHAFLAAGGVLRQTLVQRLAPAPAAPGVPALLASAGAGLGLVAAVALAFRMPPGAQPALWVMGGIVALALTPLLRPMASAAHSLGALLAVLALAALYFGAHVLLQGRVAPAEAVPAGPWWAVVALAFGALFTLQSVLSLRPQGALAARLYPWCYGGLFLDERLSQALFRRWPPPRPAAPGPTASPALRPDAA